MLNPLLNLFSMNDNELVLRVENLSKSFLIPDNLTNTLRERFVSFLKRNKRYHQYDAVNNVTFDLRKGDFLGVIGANGSGKSTLLKIISGIYAPEKGSVRAMGHLVPFLELGVGFNPELTGKENIFLNGIILGMRISEMQKHFDSIVEFSGLKEFLGLKLKNYSTGMQLRLAFSVAIHVDAEIYVLDEILAVGDWQFQQKCIAFLNSLKGQGKSIILVSHDMNSIRNLCDRVILLQDGRLCMYDNPDKVINFYTHGGVDIK